MAPPDDQAAQPSGQASQSPSQAQLPAGQPQPQQQQEEIELEEAGMAIVKKNIKDVSKGAGYIKLAGKPDVVLQVQSGFATIRKKKPVKPDTFIEPL